jgi:hypothetical protein
MREIQVIDRAIAHARREAYRAAAGMTTAELRACEPAYRAATGVTEITGEALTQLRMVRTIVAHRARSTRSRARAAAQFRASRGGRA